MYLAGKVSSLDLQGAFEQPTHFSTARACFSVGSLPSWSLIYEAFGIDIFCIFTFLHSMPYWQSTDSRLLSVAGGVIL